MKYLCWRENTWKGAVIQIDWACKQLLEDMILVAALVDKLEHKVLPVLITSGSKPILWNRVTTRVLEMPRHRTIVLKSFGAVLRM